MNKLKDIDYEILAELIKNSKLSDRQMAKKLKASQPTITRRRTELEKEHLLDYTAIPDLRKLDFEILAFTFGKWNLNGFPDTKMEEMKEFISENPSMIFVSTGRGAGWDRMAVSVHRNYSDYSRVIQNFKAIFGNHFQTFGSFIVSLRSDDILRNITFKYLTDLLKENTSAKETPRRPRRATRK